MIRIEFTEEEIAAIDYERFNHPHPRVQRKMETVWLKAKGVPHKEIARLTGFSSTTVTQHLREYKDGGIEALKTMSFFKPKSKLDTYQQIIEIEFLKNPPATIKEAGYTIEKITGIKRSETQTRKFLKRMGFKPRKIGMVPAKADIKKQKEYLKKN